MVPHVQLLPYSLKAVLRLADIRSNGVAASGLENGKMDAVISTASFR